MTSRPNVSPLEAAKILQAAMALPVSAPGASASASASASVPLTTEPTVPHIVTIKCRWDVGRAFDGKEELDYLLKYCKKRNVWVPEPDQILHLDPMKVKDMPDFEKRVGRLYSALPLGLEIYRILLSWKDAAGELRLSQFRAGWEPVQEFMMDPSNTNFDLRLVFRCVGTAGGLISLFLKTQNDPPQ